MPTRESSPSTMEDVVLRTFVPPPRVTAATAAGHVKNERNRDPRASVTHRCRGRRHGEPESSRRVSGSGESHAAACGARTSLRPRQPPALLRVCPQPARLLDGRSLWRGREDSKVALTMRRGHTRVTFTGVPGCPPGSALVSWGLTSSFQSTGKRAAEKLRRCREPRQGAAKTTRAACDWTPVPFSAVLSQPEPPGAAPRRQHGRCQRSQARPLQRRASVFSSGPRDKELPDTRCLRDKAASSQGTSTAPACHMCAQGQLCPQALVTQTTKGVGTCVHTVLDVGSRRARCGMFQKTGAPPWERNLVKVTVPRKTPGTPANSPTALARDRKGHRVPRQQEAKSAAQGSSAWAGGHLLAPKCHQGRRHPLLGYCHRSVSQPPSMWEPVCQSHHLAQPHTRPALKRARQGAVLGARCPGVSYNTCVHVHTQPRVLFRARTKNEVGRLQNVFQIRYAKLPQIGVAM